jgi:hypothetical protein
VSIVARPTRQLSRRGDTHAPLLCFSSPRGSLLVLGDMSEENKGDVDWAVMAEEFKKNHRPHAGHFSWETDRALAEWGVFQEFTNALAHEGNLFFRDARHRGDGNDPPDCEAVSVDGERIGIEITELVDGRSIEAARLDKPYDWKDWKGALVPELQKLVHRKDKPGGVNGGPYSQYVLLIFSDEPWLERDHVERSRKEHSFDTAALITRAFLLLSYDPFLRRYPYYELRLSPNNALQATCEDARA